MVIGLHMYTSLWMFRPYLEMYREQLFKCMHNNCAWNNNQQ